MLSAANNSVILSAQHTELLKKKKKQHKKLQLHLTYHNCNMITKWVRI